MKLLKKYFSYKFIVLGLLLTVSSAFSQEMAPYCCAPPFVTTVVSPNILISLDNSGSMFQRAYSENTIYISDTTSYYGYFKPDSNYRWSTNRFVSDPNGPWPGSILNWACMSRADVAKKVLTGGKANYVGSDRARLVSEGSGSWTKYYRRDSNNYNEFYITHSARVTYVEIEMHGSNPPINAKLDREAVQVDMPQEEHRGVLDQIGDKDDDRHFDDDAPLFGLWHYNDNQGGHIRDYIGEPDIIDMRNHINEMVCETWTPLAENYLEILHYFSQANPYYYMADYSANPGGQHDPYHDNIINDMVPCRRSFVLMITDGESTQDQDIPNTDYDLPDAYDLRDYDNDGNDPGNYPSNGSDYLDDICLYGHVNDLRPEPGSGWGNRELEDDQSIEAFVIYAFGTSGSRLLMDAAKNGGFEDSNDNNIPDLQSEWDEDGDDIPDNYFDARNGYELEAAVLSAIMEMLSRISSASAVGVVSAGSKAGGLTVQSQFYPRRIFKTDEILTWIGTCQGLWVDAYGWIREDTDEDAILHLQNDHVVSMRFDPQAGPNGNVTVTRLLDVNGTGDPAQFDTVEIVEIEDLVPIWDGGEWLWHHSPDERNIFAFVDANKNGIVDPNEIQSFLSSNASLLRPYLGASTVEQADTIIRYIRGTDFPRLRPRTADGSVWKLGDVINAGAVAVQGAIERYDFIYGDNSYVDFYDKYRDRRQVVFVGANDGMLHCFNGGKTVRTDDPMQPLKLDPAGYDLGEELWSYIPYNLLPHVKWLKERGYCHVYYVDLKTYATDAQIFTPDIVHPNGWGTILIGGMRLGGMKIDNEADAYSSAYFAIDITDPLNPAPLWEFTSDDIGLTFCYSTVIKVKDSWYSIFGSGPFTCAGESNQNAKIFVLDLKTGVLLKEWVLPDNNSFVTNILGVDWGLDYTVDRIYFADCYRNTALPGKWGGKIYRILTNDNRDPDFWNLAAVFNMERPITGEGNIATDDYNHLWLYYGSGRFFSDVDEADQTRQRYVGIREDTTHTYTVSGLYNVTDVRIDTNGVVYYPDNSTSTFDELTDAVNTSAGWWREFEAPGEKNLTSSLVFGGAVLFTTFIPIGDICSYGGVGNFYALYYRTGTAYIEPFLEADTSAWHPIFVSLDPGMPSEPKLYIRSDEAKVFIQAGGGIVSPETGIPGLPESDVILWKGR